MLADLESADGLAVQTQDRAELGAARAHSDAVQKALSVLKLGVLPILFAWIFRVPGGALVSGLMCLTGSGSAVWCIRVSNRECQQCALCLILPDWAAKTHIAQQ